MTNNLKVTGTLSSDVLQEQHLEQVTLPLIEKP